MDCDKYDCTLTDCDVYSCVKPVVNWKCVVLTIVLALAYWYLPYRNGFVLLAILYFTYLALAWYDYWYACKRNMGPTYLSLFYAPFKPQESEQIQEYKNWHPTIKQRVLKVDIVIAVIVLSLFVVYFITR
jgi:hypothetical protein